MLRKDPAGAAGAAGASAREPFEGDLVEVVARSIIEDEAFRETCDDWVLARCGEVPDPGEGTAEAAEESLASTALHEEFKALYERQIEACIQGHGATPVEFYKQIRESQDSSDAASSKALVGQILLETFSFDVFMAMMREAKESSRRK